MSSRYLARKVFPVAGAVAVGAFVFLWLTDKKK